MNSHLAMWADLLTIDDVERLKLHESLSLKDQLELALSLLHRITEFLLFFTFLLFYQVARGHIDAYMKMGPTKSGSPGLLRSHTYGYFSNQIRGLSTIF